MSISKYQVFLKVAACGNFTRAAEALHFTQSGISHTIAALEEELGVPLFLRNRGGVSLTADGRALLPYVQALCDDVHQLEQKAADLRGLETGLVRVATFPSVSFQWLPYMLKSFQQQYPGIEFELLLSEHNNKMEEWVLNGQVDCCFSCLPAALPVESWLLQRDQWRVIVPCNHPLAGRNPFPVEALAAEPFIQLEEGDDYEIAAIFDKLAIQPNIRYTVQEDQTILAMVSAGLGISIMPELMLAHSPYPFAACALPEPFYRNIGISVKDKNRLSLSTRRFVDHARHWVLTQYTP